MMERILSKLVSVIVIMTFSVNTLCYGLATLPASQNPIVKRRILATLTGTQIRYAESEDAKKLLEVNNATSLLLSSGNYLITKEVAENNIRLLKEINHKDIEALMQILAKYDRYKYQAIKELILKHFPPTETNILPIDLYVNHTVARAFEWLLLVEDGVVSRKEISLQEKDFIDAMELIIIANRHNYFTHEFWDSKIRREKIRVAVNEGIRFYQVANDDRADRAKRAAEALGDIDLGDDIRILASEQIGEFGVVTDEIIFALKQSISDDEDVDLRVTSVKSLGKLALYSDDALTALKWVLDIPDTLHADCYHFAAALDMLCRIGPERGFIPFSKLEEFAELWRVSLMDEDRELSRVAKRAIGIITPDSDNDKAIEYLAKESDLDGDYEVDIDIEIAREALSNRGKDAVDILSGYLNERIPWTDENPKLFTNIVDIIGKIGPEAASSVPLLIKILEEPPIFLDATRDENEELTKRTMRALGNIGQEAYAAIPVLIRRTSSRGDKVPRALISDVESEAAAALSKIGDVTDISKSLFILPDLLDLAVPSPYVAMAHGAKAAEYIEPLVEDIENKLTDEVWDTIIARNKIEVLLWLYENYRSLFDNAARRIPWLGSVRTLLSQIEEEVKAYPENDQAIFRRQLCSAINGHIWECVSDERRIQTILSEYNEILSFLQIVHDNLPSCLDSLKQIKMRAGYFSSLRKALPFNNALTRIIRMLGEEGRTGRGFRNLSLQIKKSGQFDSLYEIILDIAKKRGTRAPQEVLGLLEILEKYQNLSSWTKTDWKIFGERLQRYYATGNKIITYQLFIYFAEHEHDPDAIEMIKKDIDRELLHGNIAWGEFTGLSDNFKEKYGLSTEDELALMARYMPIANLTARDYAKKCEEIKGVLTQRKDTWNNELDPGMRELFALKGTRSQALYQPEDKDRIDREKLHEALRRYAEESETGRKPAAIIEGFILGEEGTNPDDVKKAAVAFCIQNSQLDRDYYASIPQTEAELQRWVSEWYAVLADAYKHDVANKVRQIARGTVGKAGDDILMSLLASHRIPEFQTITKDRKLFAVDKKMATTILEVILAEDEATKTNRKEELAELFKNKWMALLTMQTIRDESLIAAWIDNGIQKAAAKILRLIKESSQNVKLELKDIESVIKEAILDARSLQEEETAGMTDLDRKKIRLADKMAREAITLFSDEISQLEKEQKGFKTVEREVAQQFYTGFFDDLLHLMGFMMTGVCTWTERDKQIADTKYHFGKIALKDGDGKILGLSQVQLLRCGIVGYPSKQSAKGWRVIALPGINLDQGDININRERAMLSILETAQRYAEVLGMMGAVIPISSEIRSNHGFENRFIQELVSKGWLRKVSLTENVRLSSGYTYDNVYLVTIPEEEMILAPASRKEKLKQNQSEAERFEREKVVPFGYGLGEIVYTKEVSEVTVASVTKSIEDVIANMPQQVIDNIRLVASTMGIALKVRIEPDKEKSFVNKAQDEIELTIGKDILYEEGKIETVTLAEMISEFLAAFIFDDYDELKEKSSTNENAYFKLELVKILLGYKGYLWRYHKVISKNNWGKINYPSEKSHQEQEQLLQKYKADLDKFTQGIKNISQWNIFLNVMDDADPDFVVMNYAHILLRERLIRDDDVENLIAAIRNMDITDKLSIAGLRNLFKDFVLFGTARLMQADKVETKDKFAHFDTTDTMQEVKEILLTTIDEAQFYHAFRRLLGMSLVLPEHSINDEVSRFLDKNIVILEPDRREKAIRDVIREVLIRRMGSRAFTSFERHLKAQRGTEEIPYITLNFRDNVAEGLDADTFGAFAYQSEDGINYELVFRAAENIEEPEFKDWVHDLFNMKPPEGNEDTNLSRGQIDEIAETHPALDKAANEGRMFALTNSQLSKISAKRLDAKNLADLFLGNLVNLKSPSYTREKLLERLENDSLFRENLLKGFQFMQNSIKSHSLPQDKPIRLSIIIEDQGAPTIVFKDSFNNLIAHSGRGKKTDTPYTSIYIGYESLVRAVESNRKNAFQEIVSHEAQDIIRGQHVDKESKEVTMLYNDVLDLYDAGATLALSVDIINPQLQEDRTYIIKYDESLSASQKAIIETYADLLDRKSKATVKARECSKKRRSSESLINVYCEDNTHNVIGEGHVDVSIPEGNISDYLLRITGMVNIALAASNIPANILSEELQKSYGHIVGFIKRQYKAVIGKDMILPETTEALLDAIRYIILDLPRAHKMPADRIEEYNRLARQALISA